MATVMAHSALICTRSLMFQAPRITVRIWPRRCRNLGPVQAGRCYATFLSREDRNNLLMGVDPGNLEAVSRVLEQARRAADRWVVAHSVFFPPPTLSDCLLALRRTADIGVAVTGGYAEAERCRVSVGNSEAMTSSVREEIESSAVAAVSVAGNFKFDPAAHGDFLGAVLNTGVVREKVGDIIVKGDEGAQVLVVPELVGFLCATVTQVRGVPVETSQISLSDLAVRVVSKDVFKTVEASLRVDAIASAGFRISRTKLSDSISGGALSVNWKVITKSGAALKTGDIVSLRGKGRIEVGEINVTKKDEQMLETKAISFNEPSHNRRLHIFIDPGQSSKLQTISISRLALHRRPSLIKQGTSRGHQF